MDSSPAAQFASYQDVRPPWSMSRPHGFRPHPPRQDSIFKGHGKVIADGTATLRGDGTRFREQLEAGAMVEVGGSAPAKVTEVVSDTEVLVEGELKATRDRALGSSDRPRIDPRLGDLRPSASQRVTESRPRRPDCAPPRFSHAGHGVCGVQPSAPLGAKRTSAGPFITCRHHVPERPIGAMHI